MISVCASPNIAFIKYWGKVFSNSDHTRNIGVNASLSMTLNNAKTFVDLEASTTGAHQIWIEGTIASATDNQKIIDHIARIEDHFKNSHPQGAGFLHIRSRNNFPHSAGIASSASAFCALTIAICAAVIGKEQTQTLLDTQPEVISMLARRGSGSAARSVCGGYMLWQGWHAIKIAVDWPLRDTIVILSKSSKTISSSEGHARALTSRHFAERLNHLPERTTALQRALKSRNLHELGALLEAEALEMHMIAETSVPPVHYLSPDSRKVIGAIQALPQRNFYFTVDAGPNLHIISESSVTQTLQTLLKDLQLEAEIWEDGLGTGPTLE